MDRAALDWAIANGLDHGGWCPKNRRAEDGRLHDRYRLRETRQIAYPIRTRLNVEMADATLILYRPPMGSGTGLTSRIVAEVGRPYITIRLDRDDDDELVQFILQHRPMTLNIAGPRESGSPGIYLDTIAFLDRTLGSLAPDLPDN